MRKLEERGYIRRDPTKPRAIEILKPRKDHPDSGIYRSVVNVPVVGRVTAGEPILAVENIEDYFPVPQDLVRDQEVFMLRIQGDSMIEAGIFDRDYVLVEKTSAAKNGDIVVALVGDEEATVKRFFHEGTHVRLQPENSALAPIIVHEVMILGKVIGLFRSIK